MFSRQHRHFWLFGIWVLLALLPVGRTFAATPVVELDCHGAAPDGTSIHIEADLNGPAVLLAAWLPRDAEVATLTPAVADGKLQRRGTGSEDYRFWRADDLLAPVCLIKPAAGNFRPILSSGRTVDRFFSMVDVGLAGTPLTEVFSGQGLAIICQALVTEAENDPCAATILKNMLTYSSSQKICNTASEIQASE
jgi:hypothetical protein